MASELVAIKLAVLAADSKTDPSTIILGASTVEARLKAVKNKGRKREMSHTRSANIMETCNITSINIGLKHSVLIKLHPRANGTFLSSIQYSLHTSSPFCLPIISPHKFPTQTDLLTNSLVGRGHEGGSGSNKEGEEEEGTHLDSVIRGECELFVLTLTWWQGAQRATS